jgi:uncharacterized protein
VTSVRAPLTREDVLLLLVEGGTGRHPMDPIRLMKGAFLVVRRGRPDWNQLFNFQAYDYGPFDRQVYDSRDTLIRRGLIEVRPGRYEQYELTQSGEDATAELEARFGGAAEWIEKIGTYVTSRSFNQLLEDIYTEYPEYRERSIHSQ